MSEQQGLNITEAAEVLGLRRSWVRDAVTAHKIPHHRIGRHVRFFPEDIEEIKKQTAVPVITESTPMVSPRRGRRVA
jgi:excisionase family DNA binding protein